MNDQPRSDGAQSHDVALVLGMTLREMVQEVYADVKVMRSWMDETKPQKLPERVDELESLRDKLTGLSWAGAILGFLGLMGGLVGLVVSLGGSLVR